MKTARAKLPTLNELLEDCYLEARRQGYPGGRFDYEPSESDLDYVTDMLGRKPSRAEWHAAGLRYIGEKHCGPSGHLRRR